MISPDTVALFNADEITQNLTVRDYQFLSFICPGHSTNGIAEMLIVRTKTIHDHRTNLMAKLQVRSVTELLAFALREGLLDGLWEL